MPPRRSTRGINSYPTAPQIRDAYSQLPLQFGKQSFPTPKHKSKTKTKTKFPSSASGSNCTPLSTPEEVEARRQASNAWKVGRAPGKFINVGGFRVPAPPLAEIEGRQVGDNKKLAEGLKMILEDDIPGEENEEKDQVSTTTKNAPSLYQHEREALSKAFQQEYSLAHIDKRCRTDMIAGQEVGRGVIGSTHTPLHAVTAEGKQYMAKVIEGEHGCDTPIYTFEDARRGIAIPEGCLDPDLPPLAIEHPARMWNSLIHSLEPGLQPVVKWDYDKAEGGYIANLTLALPPTHPSIISHPLAITIPKNTSSKEYIAVLDLLGGVRRYRGEVRKLKAEAQNCALVKCIADNAISWIYAPVPQGHLDAEKDDQVIIDGVPDGEMIDNEAAGAGDQSDEIVIDIDDLLGEVSASTQISRSSDQDQTDTEMEVSREEEAVQKREDEAKNDIMTFQEMLDDDKTESYDPSESSQFLSDQGELVDTERGESIKDPEDVEYSTDNSSIIENPDHRALTPRWDEFHR